MEILPMCHDGRDAHLSGIRPSCRRRSITCLGVNISSVVRRLHSPYIQEFSCSERILDIVDGRSTYKRGGMTRQRREDDSRLKIYSLYTHGSLVWTRASECENRVTGLWVTVISVMGL